MVDPKRQSHIQLMRNLFVMLCLESALTFLSLPLVFGELILLVTAKLSFGHRLEFLSVCIFLSTIFKSESDKTISIRSQPMMLGTSLLNRTTDIVSFVMLELSRDFLDVPLLHAVSYVVD